MQLNGEVIRNEDQWLYDWFEIPAFSPQTIRNALEATDELILEINSPGGSVFAAFEMYTILKNAKIRTVAEVQSLAASAASILMLGCDEVVASPVAQIMIHLPWTQTTGDREEHMGSVRELDSIADSILNAYAIKCAGRSERAELRRLMETSTWMTAPEAKGLGLIDRILGEETLDPAAVLGCAGGVSRFIRAASGPKPTADELRAEYQKLVAEGKAPVRDGITAEPTGAGNHQELICGLKSCGLLPANYGTAAESAAGEISQKSPAPEKGKGKPLDMLLREYHASLIRDMTLAREGFGPWSGTTENSQDVQTAKAALELEKIRFLEGSMNA